MFGLQKALQRHPFKTFQKVLEFFPPSGPLSLLRVVLYIRSTYVTRWTPFRFPLSLVPSSLVLGGVMIAADFKDKPEGHQAIIKDQAESKLSPHPGKSSEINDFVNIP